METPPFEEDLLSRVRALSLSPEKERRRVLGFAEALAEALAEARPAGVPGRDLLHFAGAFDTDALRNIERAVEEDCERVDPDEW